MHICNKSFSKGAGGESEELFKGATGCSSAQQVEPKSQLLTWTYVGLDKSTCSSAQQVKTRITMINMSILIIVQSK